MYRGWYAALPFPDSGSRPPRPSPALRRRPHSFIRGLGLQLLYTSGSDLVRAYEREDARTCDVCGLTTRGCLKAAPRTLVTTVKRQRFESFNIGIPHATVNDPPIEGEKEGERQGERERERERERKRERKRETEREREAEREREGGREGEREEERARELARERARARERDALAFGATWQARGQTRRLCCLTPRLSCSGCAPAAVPLPLTVCVCVCVCLCDCL